MGISKPYLAWENTNSSVITHRPEQKWHPGIWMITISGLENQNPPVSSYMFGVCFWIITRRGSCYMSLCKWISQRFEHFLKLRVKNVARERREAKPFHTEHQEWGVLERECCIFSISASALFSRQLDLYFPEKGFMPGLILILPDSLRNGALCWSIGI